MMLRDLRAFHFYLINVHLKTSSVTVLCFSLEGKTLLSTKISMWSQLK